MRVLQLIDSLDAGGAERMAVNIANMLSNCVGQGFLSTTRKEGSLKEELDEKVKFIFIQKKSILDFKAYNKLLHFVKEHRITIIHAHTTSIYTGYIIKMRYPKIKLVWHDHYGLSEFVNDRPQRLLKFLSRSFSGIISCNTVLRDWAIKSLHCKHVIYLPNFIVEKKEEILQTKIYGQEGKRVVCLANLRAQKNHIALIDAFSNLGAVYKDWTLHLVGMDYGDSYSKSLKKRIIENNIDKQVFIYGSRPDVFAILKQMDIGVLYSKSEGLPLALLEYGISGLPVITTNVGFCKEVVGKAGLIIENLEKEGIDHLKSYMNNPDLRNVHGNLFKESIEKKYGTSSSWAVLESFYKQLNSNQTYV